MSIRLRLSTSPALRIFLTVFQSMSFETLHPAIEATIVISHVFAKAQTAFETRRSMESWCIMERSGTPCAHLIELESKFGMKTPEGLLNWSSVDPQVIDHGTSDSLTDKIINLKREMVCLRATDVQILRQLVALYKGLEAVRWLLEERGTLVSRGSSLTGSQSSLTEGPTPGPGMSPSCEGLCLGLSDRQSPLINDNEKTEPGPEEEEEWPAPNSVTGHSNFNMLPNTAFSKATGHRLTLDEAIDGNIVGVKEQSMPSSKVLFGYDAQWCWVESQDDVTFL
ncbi:leucine rich adaptor protein 1-like isoform X2 [Esox lucius]|uniref:Leucine rich adaptor protein 1 n=1 Tax=Esox lucius TaxID=8010 RepID=A0A3P8ZBC8_ESOLU|nr:leucine rich adaptor protein 1-like isoform X2 [Esox lucius]